MNGSPKPAPRARSGDGSEGGPPAELPLRRIRARRGWIGVDWRELWQFRELLYFLTWRDVKVRYRQTVLGFLWAILQPLASMAVFSVFFGRLAGLERATGGVPYPVFVYAGLLPWMFFASATAASAASLVGSANLVSKVYFPRLVVPLGAVGSALVDLALSLLVFLAMLVYHGVGLAAPVALVPVFLLHAIVAAAGVGLLLSALTVAYRDFRYVVPFLLQLWLFVTPVIYPISIVPEEWRWLLAVNPMAGAVAGFRSAFLGAPFDWPAMAVSFASSVLLLAGGVVYFRRVERGFADII